MSSRPVTRMGNPVLRQVAQDVEVSEINSPEFKSLLKDMYDTMKKEDGIGIAAPQIGVSKQVALIEIPEHSPRYPKAMGSKLFTIINPKIEIIDENKQGFWEGCLSVPGLRGFVERPKGIKVDFLDEDANEQSLELHDFLATVFQHEIDHLFGTLFIDKVTDKSKLTYLQEYEDFWLNES